MNLRFVWNWFLWVGILTGWEGGALRATSESYKIGRVCVQIIL